MALTHALANWQPDYLDSVPPAERSRLERIPDALEIARQFLTPRILTDAVPTAKPQETPDVTAAFKIIVREGLTRTLYDEFIDMVEANFFRIGEVVTRAMQELEGSTPEEPHQDILAIIANLFERLASWQRAWGLPLRAFQHPQLISQYTRTFHQLLHSLLPPSFPTHFLTFLQASLASIPEHLTNPPPHSTLFQSVPMNPHKIPPPTPHLSRLGVFPRYSGTLSKVAHDEIERIAREEAGKGWDERRLTRARQRIGDGVANWLSGMFEANESAQHALRPMFSRFDYYLCRCFFDIRTDELFDIIVDFPESMAALEDLKECLFKVDQRLELVTKLNAAILKRLLHPGAETHVILNFYISTIRCLRILDPLGVLLHKVALPIRTHLRSRPDTIKSIVETLVDGDKLQDENGGLIPTSNDDEIESFGDPRWEPEPADAAPEFRSGRTGDIVSTLVSIFETREVIIKELQVYLATHLLAVKDYDAVQDIRTIELLKLRFGDDALKGCDVMVKDVADSKRIDDRVQQDRQSVVHPLVISRLFWPNIPGSSLHLPPKLEKAQAAYEAAFHHFKPDKHLRFVQHLGTVSLTLTLTDRTITVDATPLQASIMELFESQDVWKAEALEEKLGVDGPQVRKALGWWAVQGVVKEEAGGWRLLEVEEMEEEGEDGVVGVGGEVGGEEVFGDGAGRVDEAQAEEVRRFWPHIKSALFNLQPLALHRLHESLGVFREYHHTAAELEMFLEIASREGLVQQLRDGRWALVA
ncbi:hypothetical protein IAT38_003703 [Cryptococcus sp. DSM 104549]